MISDIDNAGDLDTLGGLKPTLDLLSHPSGRVQQAALWVVGSTVQSNPKTQELVFNYGALPAILAPVQAASVDGGAGTDPRVLAKGLYALSALLRGCARCLDDFAQRGGAGVLAALLARLPPDAAWLPARRKAAALVGDLVQEEGAAAAVARLSAEFAPSVGGSSGRTPALLALLPQLRSGDRELQVCRATLFTFRARIRCCSSATVLIYFTAPWQEKSLETLLALIRAAPAAAGAWHRRSTARAHRTSASTLQAHARPRHCGLLLPRKWRSGAEAGPR